MDDYQAWSVIAGEVPTETKWNILGVNDETFYNELIARETGWINVGVSLSYSAYADQVGTANVSGVADARSLFEVGDKIRFKQGADYLYFKITDVTSGTIKFTAGGIYTFANSAVTDFYVAKGTSPVDWPLPKNILVTLTSASNVAIDLNVSKSFYISLGHNPTFSISNAKIGDIFSIDIVGNGYSITSWFSTLKWVDNAIPGLSGSTKIDSFIFKCVATNTFAGGLALPNC